MIFKNPVEGAIGLAAADPEPWFRSQAFGCTGFALEPPLGNCKHFHRGVDVARGPAGCGDNALAVGKGTVIFAGILNGGSKAIVIRHAGGLATGISHLSSIGVKAGAKVLAGQRIGAVGKTGNATGCHVHTAYKTGFPSTGNVNDFYRDAVGKWADIWPQLAQNVTVHPKDLDAINIRIGAGQGTIPAPKYASTKDGEIIRTDGANLGPVGRPHNWGGTVAGASYTLDGKVGTMWEKIELDGAYRFIASPLAVLSAR